MGKTNDYISPSKLKRTRLSTSESCSKNTLLSSKGSPLTSLLQGFESTALDYVLPSVLDYPDNVASTLHLVGRAVVSTSEAFILTCLLWR